MATVLHSTTMPAPKASEVFPAAPAAPSAPAQAAPSPRKPRVKEKKPANDKNVLPAAAIYGAVSKPKVVAAAAGGGAKAKKKPQSGAASPESLSPKALNGGAAAGGGAAAAAALAGQVMYDDALVARLIAVADAAAGELVGGGAAEAAATDLDVGALLSKLEAELDSRGGRRKRTGAALSDGKLRQSHASKAQLQADLAALRAQVAEAQSALAAAAGPKDTPGGSVGGPGAAAAPAAAASKSAAEKQLEASQRQQQMLQKDLHETRRKSIHRAEAAADTRARPLQKELDESKRQVSELHSFRRELEAKIAAMKQELEAAVFDEKKARDLLEVSDKQVAATRGELDTMQAAMDEAQRAHVESESRDVEQMSALLERIEQLKKAAPPEAAAAAAAPAAAAPAAAAAAAAPAGDNTPSRATGRRKASVTLAVSSDPPEFAARLDRAAGEANDARLLVTSLENQLAMSQARAAKAETYCDEKSAYLEAELKHEKGKTSEARDEAAALTKRADAAEVATAALQAQLEAAERRFEEQKTFSDDKVRAIEGELQVAHKELEQPGSSTAPKKPDGPKAPVPEPPSASELASFGTFTTASPKPAPGTLNSIMDQPSGDMPSVKTPRGRSGSRGSFCMTKRGMMRQDTGVAASQNAPRPRRASVGTREVAGFAEGDEDEDDGSDSEATGAKGPKIVTKSGFVRQASYKDSTAPAAPAIISETREVQEKRRASMRGVTRQQTGIAAPKVGTKRGAAARGGGGGGLGSIGAGLPSSGAGEAKMGGGLGGFAEDGEDEDEDEDDGKPKIDDGKLDAFSANAIGEGEESDDTDGSETHDFGAAPRHEARIAMRRLSNGAVDIGTP